MLKVLWLLLKSWMDSGCLFGAGFAVLWSSTNAPIGKVLNLTSDATGGEMHGFVCIDNCMHREVLDCFVCILACTSVFLVFNRVCHV